MYHRLFLGARRCGLARHRTQCLRIPRPVTSWTAAVAISLAGLRPRQSRRARPTAMAGLERLTHHGGLAVQSKVNSRPPRQRNQMLDISPMRPSLDSRNESCRTRPHSTGIIEITPTILSHHHTRARDTFTAGPRGRTRPRFGARRDLGGIDHRADARVTPQPM